MQHHRFASGRLGRCDIGTASQNTSLCHVLQKTVYPTTNFPGIGSSFLLKRRDAPRLFGVPRRFVSFGAFWLGCGVGVISVMAFLLEPCIAEQELIEAKLYRKVRSGNQVFHSWKFYFVKEPLSVPILLKSSSFIFSTSDAKRATTRSETSGGADNV